MAIKIFLTSLVFISLFLFIISAFDYYDFGEKIGGGILILLALSIISAVASLIAVIWQ